MTKKQHSFSLNLADPREKELNDFLAGKPTTFILIEALTLYKRFEDARKAAINTAIDVMVAPQPRAQAAPSTAYRGANDDIEEFDM